VFETSGSKCSIKLFLCAVESFLTSFIELPPLAISASFKRSIA